MSKLRLFSHAASALGLALMLAFAAIFFMWHPYSGTGPMMRDFESYYAAGATWSSGGDPYSTQIWAAEKAVPGADDGRLEVLPFLGPPVSLPLWSALARLPYQAAVALWCVVLAVAVGVIFLGSFAFAGRRPTWWDLPIVVAISASFAPLSYGFSLGQAALAAMGLMIATLWCTRVGRWRASSLAVFLAVALKPNVSLALVGLLRSRRGLICVATAAAAFVGANLVAAGGVPGMMRYAHALRGHTAAERLSVLQMTPTSIAFGFGVPEAMALFVGSAVAFIALAVLGIYLLRVRADEVEAAALACLALPFVSPFLHVHDLVVTLLPVILCVHWARGRTWVVGAIGSVLIAPGWVALTQGPIGAPYVGFVMAAFALQIFALGRAQPMRTRLLPLLVPLCIIPLAFAVPSKAIPLWPDGLPAHFSVSLDQPVSSVWKAEQVAVGLERVDPFAALVRSFALVGCVLVGGALGLTVAQRRRAPGEGRVLDEMPEFGPERRQRQTRIAANVDG